MSAKHPGHRRLTPGTCDLGYIRVFGVEVVPLSHYRSVFFIIVPIAAASSHLKRLAAGGKASTNREAGIEEIKDAGQRSDALHLRVKIKD